MPSPAAWFQIPGDHVSFAKFLDVLFDLPPLASLPDEKPYLPEGPRDANPRLTDLLGGFDAARLAGPQASHSRVRCGDPRRHGESRFPRP